MAENLPLPAQLSAAFVAMAIEMDNGAEQDIAHHTTSFGKPGGLGSVWLTSIAMWFNAIRVLAEDDQLTVAQVRDRSGLDTNVDGLRRWGYVTVDGVGRRLDGQKRPLPKPRSVLALTERGRDAAAVWGQSPAAVEQRWRDRFTGAAVQRLRTALLAVAERADHELPDYLPILGVGLWAERRRAQPLGPPTPSVAADDAAALPLISLLARVLLALTLDYEVDARLAVPTWANALRLMTAEPTPMRDLPARAGVAAEAMAMILKHLQRAGCVEIASVTGIRGKQAWLTALGERARTAGGLRYAALSAPGASRSRGSLDELGSALQPLVGDGTRGGSPLFTGLDPGPANWRAGIRPIETLPWYPMVLHRGGFPDGS